MHGQSGTYCEVEKRKKGDVFLKAAADCNARATAHNREGAIVIV